MVRTLRSPEYQWLRITRRMPCRSKRTLKLISSASDVLVCHRNRYLPLEPDASEPKLDAQCLLVDGLEQPGTQNTVDLHCGVDHDAGSLVEFIIGFRQPGVFGVLAVHASDIGLRGSRLPCTRESSCEDPTLFTTTDSPEERKSRRRDRPREGSGIRGIYGKHR